MDQLNEAVDGTAHAMSQYSVNIHFLSSPSAIVCGDTAAQNPEGGSEASPCLHEQEVVAAAWRVCPFGCPPSVLCSPGFMIEISWAFLTLVAFYFSISLNFCAIS